jgi:hypothetical protein
MQCRGRELSEKILVAQLALFHAFYGTEWIIITIMFPTWSKLNIGHVFVTYLSDNNFNNIKIGKRYISDKFSHLGLGLGILSKWSPVFTFCFKNLWCFSYSPVNIKIIHL